VSDSGGPVSDKAHVAKVSASAIETLKRKFCIRKLSADGTLKTDAYREAALI